MSYVRVRFSDGVLKTASEEARSSRRSRVTCGARRRARVVRHGSKGCRRRDRVGHRVGSAETPEDRGRVRRLRGEAVGRRVLVALPVRRRVHLQRAPGGRRVHVHHVPRAPGGGNPRGVDPARVRGGPGRRYRRGRALGRGGLRRRARGGCRGVRGGPRVRVLERRLRSLLRAPGHRPRLSRGFRVRVGRTEAALRLGAPDVRRRAPPDALRGDQILRVERRRRDVRARELRVRGFDRPRALRALRAAGVRVERGGR